jgi:bacteriocin-like protein
MNQITNHTPSDQRLLLRNLAQIEQLTEDDLESVSGGMRPYFTARSSTRCCDVDGGCD